MRRLAALGLVGLAVAALSACSLLPGKAAIDHDKLDAALDASLGGASTCVVLIDTKSGAVAYQYGALDVCMARQPPCAAFDVPLALIGLGQGVISPQSIYKWDGTTQPVGAWQTDADVSRAFHDGIQWWWGDLAQAIGHDRLAAALGRFDYGDKAIGGPASSFWMGPQAGGTLAISTRQQAVFFRRFYHGDLGASPEASALIQGLMVDEVRNDSKLGSATFSSAPGSCAITADGSRSVGWSAGRLKTRDRDLIFAASVAGENAPPGIEVGQKLKDSFAAAGLWPKG